MEFVLAAHDNAARAGYLFLEVELYTRANCQPYTSSWMSAFLSLSRYAPSIITFVLYFAGLRYKELYLLLFGFGLTIDAWIGYGLNTLIVNEPRIAGCLPVFGSAIAYQVQHAAFFTTFSLGYVSLYQPRTKLWHVAVVLLFYASVVLGAHYLNYYQSAAIVAGAALGSLNALWYQSALFWIVVPTFYIVLRSRLVRYMAYQDTLCTGDCTPAHVIAVEQFDRTFDSRQRQISRQRAKEFVASQMF